MKRMKSGFHWATTVALIVLLTSCATSKVSQDDAKKVLDDFVFNKVAPLIQYDPYTAKIHYDKDKIQSLFEECKRQVKLCGCSIRPVTAFGNKEKWSQGYYQADGYQNIEWTNQVYDQLAINKNGWAVAQLEYPKAGLQHGDFSVKCIMHLAIIWCGATLQNPLYDLRYDFAIKNKSLPNSTTKTSNTAQQPSTTEKSKQLKELFDNGLITKEEYDQKRKQILGNL